MILVVNQRQSWELGASMTSVVTHAIITKGTSSGGRGH